ncbi:MAG: hypothetical protein PHZ05_03065, partial [Pygmaiobacter massiliensis]|nr:hypothetical protein [Pygmaiobacter massiliensis]
KNQIYTLCKAENRKKTSVVYEDICFFMMLEKIIWVTNRALMQPRALGGFRVLCEKANLPEAEIKDVLCQTDRKKHSLLRVVNPANVRPLCSVCFATA